MTTYQQARSNQLTASTSPDSSRVNCVVSIITDDDSDADTLKDSSANYSDRRDSSGSYVFCCDSASRSKAPMIKHIASSSSVCTMDTETRANLNCVNSHSQTQLNGTSRSNKSLGGRPYSGSTSGNAGCVPILLSVPSAGPPRRRHSWICG